jgi:phosphatidylserine/phosphatidylglycerophosphate/cardiolipin synthase-like enzyme
MTGTLVESIRSFVEQSTIELTERVAAALEVRGSWDDPARFPYIPTPKLNALFADILREARAVGRLPPDVALALRAACAVEAHHRRAARLELVLSGPAFPPFEMRRTDEVIIQMIQSAQQRLMLISFAVYRVDRLAQALGEAAQRGVDIRMFVEQDNVRYADLGRLYGEKLAAKMDIYSWANVQRQNSTNGRSGVLHAKAVVADGGQLFISSANLTEHAMSLNIEIGVLIRGGDQARKIEQLFDAYLARGVFERLRDPAE